MGESLAKTGGSGATIPCAICHGSDLRGIGPIPGIAGRSPSYLVRQLYDFQRGTRAGSSAALMKPAVPEGWTETHAEDLDSADEGARLVPGRKALAGGHDRARRLHFLAGTLNLPLGFGSSFPGSASSSVVDGPPKL